MKSATCSFAATRKRLLPFHQALEESIVSKINITILIIKKERIKKGKQKKKSQYYSESTHVSRIGLLVNGI